MPTQETINRIQDLLRQQYIVLKDSEIRRLIEYYNGSIDYLLEVLLTTPSFTNASRYSYQLADIVSTTLDSTRPTLENEFAKSLGRMLDIGASWLTIMLLESRVKVGKKTQLAIGDILQSGSSLVSEGRIIDTANITPRANVPLSISSNIWDIDSKNKINSIIQDGFLEGLSPFVIAQQIKQYSISGDGLSNAYRLAYTELTHAHAVAQVEAVRAWNADPEGEFKLLIEQYLSPLHKIYCVCDILAGVYDPSKPIPKIPRHPHCNCGQRTLIDNPENRKKIVSIEERLKDAELGENVKLLMDVDNAVRKKWTQTLSKSSNRWNAQLEEIMRNKKGEELNKSLQALANELDTNDPVGQNVLKVIKDTYGIERTTKALSTGITRTGSRILVDGKDVGLSADEVNFLNRFGVKLNTASDIDSYGAYDIGTKSIYFNPKTIGEESKATIIHEFGHALDDNLGSIGKIGDRSLLSEKTEFAKLLQSPNGTYSADTRYIITKRALGLTGEDGVRIQRYIIGGTPYNEIPTDIRLAAQNLRSYFESPQELFAEGYMLYRNDPNFKTFAPQLYNYYKSLSLETI